MTKKQWRAERREKIARANAAQNRMNDAIDEIRSVLRELDAYGFEHPGRSKLSSALYDVRAALGYLNEAAVSIPRDPPDSDPPQRRAVKTSTR